MADQSRADTPTAIAGPGPTLGRPPTPRWVKGFGIIALVLVLAFVGLHLTGNSPGGLHTMPPGTTMGETSPQP